MFSCDRCGEFALAEYEVTFTDMHKEELCEDCLASCENEGAVLMSARFPGLAPKAEEVY